MNFLPGNGKESTMRQSTMRTMCRYLATVAVALVVVGVVMSILAIWEVIVGQVVERTIATCAVLFAGHLLTLTVLFLGRKQLVDDPPN
jgi:uncharacterized membrane protein YgdD (TMEM256/DUF423 family)